MSTADVKISDGETHARAPTAAAVPPRKQPNLPPRIDAGQPCCGTAQEAADAGSCCGPAAKATAVAAGVGCCG